MVNAKVQDIRQKTYKEVLSNLKEHKRCMVIRPTGFGKTWLLADVTRALRDKNDENKTTVIYFYPNDAIRNTVIRVLYNIDNNMNISDLSEEERQKVLCDNYKNIRFMSYMALALSDRNKEAQNLFADKNIKLAMLDEVHVIGGAKSNKNFKNYLMSREDLMILGATATPERTDAYNFIKDIFKNCVVSAYTINDAIRDNMLKKPYYVYCINNPLSDNVTKKQISELKKNNFENLDKELIQELTTKNSEKSITGTRIYKGILSQKSEKLNFDSVVARSFEDMAKKGISFDTSYMKFIVFFGSIKEMDEKSNDVKRVFQKVFPKHTIKVLKIHSDNSNCTSEEYQNNAKILESKEWNRQPNEIHLICNVNMLTMGYHVDDIAGVVMMRSTNSDIVYCQQLGRALSSGENSRTALVLDVVNNINRRALIDTTDNTDNDGDEYANKIKKVNFGDKYADVTKIAQWAKRELEDSNLSRTNAKVAGEVLKKLNELGALNNILIACGIHKSDLKEDKELAKELVNSFLYATANYGNQWWSKKKTYILEQHNVILGDELASLEQIARKASTERAKIRLHRAIASILVASISNIIYNGKTYNRKNANIKVSREFIDNVYNTLQEKYNSDALSSDLLYGYTVEQVAEDFGLKPMDVMIELGRIINNDHTEVYDITSKEILVQLIYQNGRGWVDDYISKKIMAASLKDLFDGKES